jgi:hypothetical protein
VQREFKSGAYLGMPWEKKKLREFQRDEQGKMKLWQKCVECGEPTDEALVCRTCQENGELCR